MALAPIPGAAPAPPSDTDRQIRLTDPDVIDEGGARMSFLEHLEELRKRLIASVVGIIAGCFVAFFFLDRVFQFVMEPMEAMLPEGGRLITTEPTEYFMLYLKVGLLLGLFIALPFVLWQAWLFIAPGLYAHEKRFAIPFVVFSSIFFFVGAAFAHYIAFPWAWQFFVGFTGNLVAFMPRIGPAFALYVKMLLAFGVIFQMPTVVFFLARIGLVTAGFLVRNIKYAVLIIFIAAAVLSPSGDIPNQLIMAGPMLILYVLSIGIA